MIIGFSYMSACIYLIIYPILIIILRSISFFSSGIVSKGLSNNLHQPNWSEMWKTVEANREEAVMVPMITVIELCIKWFETEIIPVGIILYFV